MQWEINFLVDLLHYQLMAIRCYTAGGGLGCCYKWQGMIQGAVKLGRTTNSASKVQVHVMSQISRKRCVQAQLSHQIINKPLIKLIK